MIILGTLLVAGGCGLDLGSNEKYCESDGDCASGERCVPLASDAPAGLCVAEQRDGGMDAGTDAGMDAARPMDAGRDGGGETTDGGSDASADAGTDAGTDAAAPCEPCFADTIPDGGMGVGACTPGCLVEVDGGVTACFGAGSPSSESCNGIDDDCDGLLDEEFDLTVPARCGGCDVTCSPGLSCCDRDRTAGTDYQCTNTTTDRDFCGPGCGLVCGDGEVCCNSACADLDSDENNCGTCGNACAPGSVCCGGTCFDGATSLSHCGADLGGPGPADDSCGSACVAPDGGSVACCDGMCLDPDDDACSCGGGCGPGQSCCGSGCFDLQTSPVHCGACGTSCSSNERCCGGICTPIDTAHCTSCTGACPSAGNYHCCGEACVPVSQTDCTGCGEGCTGGTTCCPDVRTCVDLDTDEANCGTCGRSCRSDEVCTDGQCCRPGELVCGGVCTPPSPTNCSACGVGCSGLMPCCRSSDRTCVAAVLIFGCPD